jgi:hypothetical protein
MIIKIKSLISSKTYIEELPLYRWVPDNYVTSLGIYLIVRRAWRRVSDRKRLCSLQLRRSTTRPGRPPETRPRLRTIGGQATDPCDEHLDQLRCDVGQPRDCAVVLGSAASTKRISAESECEPVFFMTAAR